MPEPIAKMEEDLVKLSMAGVKKFLDGADDAAKASADSINALSAPAYGVRVQAKAVQTDVDTWKVKAKVEPVKGAPGAVYGGVRAIEREVRRQMAQAFTRLKPPT